MGSMGLALNPRAAFADDDDANIVNDVTLLNPVHVEAIATPHTTEEILHAVQARHGAISIGGARYSMGGQIAEDYSLHVDMRSFNKPVFLDAEKRIIRVQTGMRWRDVQELIDPHNLSVKIMPPYADFTVGGGLSVNAHGNYVGLGPLVNSVRAIQMVLASGAVVEASREQNAELFHGAIGGYGGLGIITEAELDLVPNTKIVRSIDRVPLAEYPAFFQSKVQGAPNIVLHNADIDFGDFDSVLATSWRRTDKDLSVTERLRPGGDATAFGNVKNWALELPGADLLRSAVIDPINSLEDVVVWRNYEAGLKMSSLGDTATSSHTFALQEYFIPPEKFGVFVSDLHRILGESDSNPVNVSIRHSPKAADTLLSWTRSDVFSFEIAYDQDSTLRAQTTVGAWTRQLIDSALGCGGSYFLPYQLHATPIQFARAYPNHAAFFALKNRLDPNYQFRNRMWDKYFPG